MSVPVEGSAPDMTPEAIQARRRRRIHERQDRARDMKAAGMTNRQVGKELDVPTETAQRMASASSRRASILQASLEPCDVEGYALTEPETMLLEALAIATFSLIDANEASMPESRVVGPIARRSQGWVSATARRRIGVRIAGPEPKPKTDARRRPWVDTDVPGLGLVEIRGNGYLHLTEKGWPVCRALFPELFA